MGHTLYMRSSPPATSLGAQREKKAGECAPGAARVGDVLVPHLTSRRHHRRVAHAGHCGRRVWLRAPQGNERSYEFPSQARCVAPALSLYCHLRNGRPCALYRRSWALSGPGRAHWQYARLPVQRRTLHHGGTECRARAVTRAGVGCYGLRVCLPTFFVCEARENNGLGTTSTGIL